MKLQIQCIETHTAGEPTRIVVAGLPSLGHGNLRQKIEVLRDKYDHIRTALMLEPRGHRDMFGAILQPAQDPEADIGVIFMNGDGYLNMCGHGSIGIMMVAVSQGLVATEGSQTMVTLETPSGLVKGTVQHDSGEVKKVVLHGVPSFLLESGVTLTLSSGEPISADVAFGGNLFALVNADFLHKNLKETPSAQLKKIAHEIYLKINQYKNWQHPEQHKIKAVDHIKFYQNTGKNTFDSVTVACVDGSPDGQVDRSPCGTGTAAKIAALYTKGALKKGDVIRNCGIIGTEFMGGIARIQPFADHQAVIPFIEGTAFVTGYARHIIDLCDPLCQGFLVR